MIIDKHKAVHLNELEICHPSGVELKRGKDFFYNPVTLSGLKKKRYVQTRESQYLLKGKKVQLHR